MQIAKPHVDLAADWLEFVDFTLTIRANTRHICR